MSGGIGGRLLAVIVLLIVYLLTLGSLAWGDIAIGVVLAGLMEAGWRRRAARGGTLSSRKAGPGEKSKVERPPLGRALVALPALVLSVLWEITRGTWEVAQYSLGLRELEHDGIVEIEMEGISEEAAALWAFTSTISPGEMVLEVDEERGILVIHTLDASDPEGMRERHHELYERYQRKVMP